ncbi:hypothetical protein DPEC_G00155300 [Dallia pectoralis]|uniref:Uncharacterized protein n=1 Tax=Dallia pectoralis TaxID=75939 RepID=A0ACC2GKY1_DALPE|nr:hypothetical protein DPEC_G00155300 [Dallia pectoralis]
MVHQTCLSEVDVRDINATQNNLKALCVICELNTFGQFQDETTGLNPGKNRTDNTDDCWTIHEGAWIDPWDRLKLLIDQEKAYQERKEEENNKKVASLKEELTKLKSFALMVVDEQQRLTEQLTQQTAKVQELTTSATQAQEELISANARVLEGEEKVFRLETELRNQASRFHQDQETMTAKLTSEDAQNRLLKQKLSTLSRQLDELEETNKTLRRAEDDLQELRDKISRGECGNSSLMEENLGPCCYTPGQELKTPMLSNSTPVKGNSKITSSITIKPTSTPIQRPSQITIPLEAFRQPGPTRIPKPKAYSSQKGANSTAANPGQSIKGPTQPALSSAKEMQRSQRQVNNPNMFNHPTRI